MKFYSYSFGCRVNQAEKEELDRNLTSIGLDFNEKNPDIYIINTCVVTKKAEKESLQFIRSLQKRYPRTKVIVVGCGSTKWIRTDTRNSNRNIVYLEKRKSENFVDIIKNMKIKNTNNMVINNPGDVYQRSGRMFLKIQDGCDRFCSYCIVPYLRGKPQSVKTNKLIEEINQTGFNIKEIILTAINTGNYGQDIDETLAGLIKSVLDETTIQRLSLGSIHPWSLDNNLINLIRILNTDKRFVKYFHIPIQSGSNKILGLMNRGYQVGDIRVKINTIWKINKMSQFGTDILVGFPGETEKDFEQTFTFLNNSPINKFHIFRYSLRKGTATESLLKRYGEPSEEIKKKRAKILTELGESKMHIFMKKHLNKTFEALFLERKINGFQEVLLENQMAAYVKTKYNYASEIKTIQIESLKDGKLLGKIIE